MFGNRVQDTAPTLSAPSANRTAISQLTSPSNPNEPTGNNKNCSEAALLGALTKRRKSGVPSEQVASRIRQLRAEAGLDPNNSNQGTTSEQLATAARKEGLKATVYNGTANERTLRNTSQNGGESIVTVKNEIGGYHSLRVDHIIPGDRNRGGTGEDVAVLQDPARTDGTLIQKPLSEVANSMREAGGHAVALKDKGAEETVNRRT